MPISCLPAHLAHLGVHSYRGERGDWEHLRRETMGMMAGVDSIQVRIASRRILISRGRGEAVQAYEIRVCRGDQVRELKGQERIGLEKEREGWKIVSGL